MKPKPRVYKERDGWMVDRPAFGFGPPSTSGPHKTHAAALRTLTGPGYAGGQVERTETPSGVVRSWYGRIRPWPLEVL
ncbi:hypothetical protein [Amycolatopsis echigonensis]|uniref:Uncharacterized protein n=1 Tax=Amycolatopsis echigonensis TaxID=2576905 RepID=A0A8E1W7T9_9PSEU|nr:hypothetical protein [Amycolatopsis echigonensis]MBB2506019.1 hypothetical protein [Amycolatopsis echigonensis]